MIRFLRYFTVILLISASFSSHAQTQGALGRRFFSNWSIGVSGGPNIFFGDLKVNSFWPVSTNNNEWRYAGTFSLTRQISYVFAIRAQVMYGGISGTKRTYNSGAPCNLYFDGTLMEYNLNTTINFSNLFSTYKSDRKFFVYGTVGIGYSSWDTKRKNLITDEIDTTGIGPYAKSAIVVIGGIGAYYSFGEKVNLGIEWTMHGVNSDYVDGTRAGFQYDAYSMAAITVTYNFNRRNPAKLQPANVGKNLGPVPVKPEPPVKPVVKTQSAGLSPGKLPELPTPLGFPVRDTVKESLPELPVADTLIFSQEEADTSSLLNDESGPSQPGLSYRVQVFAFKSNLYTAADIKAKYKLKQPVYKEFSEGWYRYTTGSFTTIGAANALMNQLRKQGIKTAFIARYDDDARVTSKDTP
jgi:hypothetical protein